MPVWPAQLQHKSHHNSDQIVIERLAARVARVLINIGDVSHALRRRHCIENHSELMISSRGGEEFGQASEHFMKVLDNDACPHWASWASSAVPVCLGGRHHGCDICGRLKVKRGFGKSFSDWPGYCRLQTCQLEKWGVVYLARYGGRGTNSQNHTRSPLQSW